MMTTTFCQRLAVSCAFALTVAGCAVSGSPGVDANFGDAVRGLNARQLIDPGAPKRNGDTTAKADGRNVRDSTDRLGESFRSPPPPTIIGITGVGGGN